MSSRSAISASDAKVEVADQVLAKEKPSHNTMKQFDKALQGTEQAESETSSVLRDALHVVANQLPRLEIVSVVKQYSADGGGTEKLIGDLSAGLVVAVMLIPQGLAYASLATLPPVYGLYSAVVSLLVYPLFGTSPELAVGPTALMSLLTAGVMTELGTDDGPEGESRRLEIALRLAFIVGVIQVAMGLCNAGVLVRFLSHPMLSGFTGAAAIIIGSSQLGKLLKLKLQRTNHVYEVWIEAIEEAGDAHGLTIALAVINLALFWAFKWTRKYLISRQKRIQATGTPQEAAAAGTAIRVLKAVPNALIIVVLNIIVATYGGLTDEGVSVVGTLETGMPDPVNIFGAGFGDDFGTLLPTGFLMALIGFMESISVGKAMALRSGGKLDSNQELVGLGMANLVGAPFNTFPVTGGFSRTIVNADAGAKTTFAGVISALVLLLAVFFLLPLFENLPDVTLGALIVFAVSKLLDFTVPAELWRLDKGDFFVYCVSFIATLLLGIEEGIMIGAGVSLAKLLLHAARPHTVQLGQVLDPHTRKPTDMFRSVDNYPELTQRFPGVTILRFDASVFFANADFFRDMVLKAALPSTVHAHNTSTTYTPREHDEPHSLVVDLGSCSTVDSTALHMLHELPAELAKGAIVWRLQHCKALQKQLKGLHAQEGSHHPAPAHGSASAAAPAAKEASPLQQEVLRLQAEVKELRAGTRKAPMLYLVALRGPVRAAFATAHKLAAEKARAAAAYTGGCRHCEVTIEPRAPPVQDEEVQPVLLAMDLAQAMPRILAAAAATQRPSGAAGTDRDAEQGTVRADSEDTSPVSLPSHEASGSAAGGLPGAAAEAATEAGEESSGESTA